MCAGPQVCVGAGSTGLGARAGDWRELGAGWRRWSWERYVLCVSSLVSVGLKLAPWLSGSLSSRCLAAFLWDLVRCGSAPACSPSLPVTSPVLSGSAHSLSAWQHLRFHPCSQGGFTSSWVTPCVSFASSHPALFSLCCSR